jgi:hypothetical protein
MLLTNNGSGLVAKENPRRCRPHIGQARPCSPFGRWTTPPTRPRIRPGHCSTTTSCSTGALNPRISKASSATRFRSGASTERRETATTDPRPTGPRFGVQGLQAAARRVPGPSTDGDRNPEPRTPSRRFRLPSAVQAAAVLRRDGSGYGGSLVQATSQGLIDTLNPVPSVQAALGQPNQRNPGPLPRGCVVSGLVGHG